MNGNDMRRVNYAASIVDFFYERVSNDIDDLKKNDVLFCRCHLKVFLLDVFACLMIAVMLSGCGGHASSIQSSQAASEASRLVSNKTLSGRIFGGRQPIVGSVVYVYAAGITGSIDPMQIGTAVTGADGTFSIDSWRVAPSNGDLIYLTAVGGDAGGGVNPTIALISVAGVWGDAHFVGHLQVNELTTIAVISQFTSYIAQVPCTSIIGSTATSGTCPRILGEADWSDRITKLAALVDVSTGQAATALQTASQSSSAYATYQNLNLQASVLANCVNSAGGVAGDGSACGNLLGLASSQAIAGTLANNGAPLTVGRTPTAIVAAHNGLFAYVTNYDDNSVSTLQIANDGTLSVLGQPTSVGINPFSFSISKDGQFGYVVNSGDNTVYTIHIGSDGRLNVVGLPTMTGDNPTALTFTKNGQFAYIANGRDGTISTFSISNGILTPVGLPLLIGTNPVSIVVSNDGQFAYVSDPGGHAIVTLAINNGSLSIVNAMNLQQGPYTMAITPSGHFSVVANFNDASFSVFRITDDALSLIGQPIPDSSRLTDVAFSPDGQFFYVVDSGLNNTETFSMDQNGNVTELGDPLQGASPWSIAISPNGQFAYITNLANASVSSYRISTGTPSDTWSAIANLQANPINTAAALFALTPSPAVYGPVPSGPPASLSLP